MHPSTGMRAVNEIDQIARFEIRGMPHVGGGEERHPRRAAGHERVRGGAAARADRPAAQLPHDCCRPVRARRSASVARRIARCSGAKFFHDRLRRVGRAQLPRRLAGRRRGELPAPIRDYVDKTRRALFPCRRGVVCGDRDRRQRRRARRDREAGDSAIRFFGLFLPPGHLIHIDEWMNTPIYPNSTERLQSGQAIQVDIIPGDGLGVFHLEYRGRHRPSRRTGTRRIRGAAPGCVVAHRSAARVHGGRGRQSASSRRFYRYAT